MHGKGGSSYSTVLVVDETEQRYLLFKTLNAIFKTYDPDHKLTSHLYISMIFFAQKATVLPFSEKNAFTNDYNQWIDLTPPIKEIGSFTNTNYDAAFKKAGDLLSFPAIPTAAKKAIILITDGSFEGSVSEDSVNDKRESMRQKVINRFWDLQNIPIYIWRVRSEECREPDSMEDYECNPNAQSGKNRFTGAEQRNKDLEWWETNAQDSTNIILLKAMQDVNRISELRPFLPASGYWEGENLYDYADGYEEDIGPNPNQRSLKLISCTNDPPLIQCKQADGELADYEIHRQAATLCNWQATKPSICSDGGDIRPDGAPYWWIKPWNLSAYGNFGVTSVITNYSAYTITFNFKEEWQELIPEKRNPYCWAAQIWNNGRLLIDNQNLTLTDASSWTLPREATEIVTVPTVITATVEVSDTHGKYLIAQYQCATEVRFAPQCPTTECQPFNLTTQDDWEYWKGEIPLAYSESPYIETPVLVTFDSSQGIHFDLEICNNNEPPKETGIPCHQSRQEGPLTTFSIFVPKRREEYYPFTLTVTTPDSALVPWQCSRSDDLIQCSQR